jgi:peptide/nickel transport system ATP-binding protein/oligopeptide transport system ATP-binding protein
VSLLAVRNLQTVFTTERGDVAAVDNVSFDVAEREILAIVGESGSGKSVTALSIMGLLPKPPARVAGGSIQFGGTELLSLDERRLRRIRGPGIGMIFQEPMTSLHPLFSIGNQIMETIRAHERLSRRACRERAIAMLEKVGIATPERRFDDYPHQLSGGMRQRVMIAMALVCRPQLLIADEPTTALDVTIQSQILELLLSLREELGMAMIIVTHNMGVVAEIADRALVMYAGKIVEHAEVGELFDRPAHPYTRGLLNCIPTLDVVHRRLPTIRGLPPNPVALPPGCPFAPRCAWQAAICDEARPVLEPAATNPGGHMAACLRLTEISVP